MGKVTVWESEVDSKLFKDKEEYIKHLRKLAGNNITRRKIERMEANRQIIMQKMGQIESTNELTQFIRDNWQWFWANGASKCQWRWKEKPPFHELVDVKIENLRWEEYCNNMHSCPQGGVTNFSRGHNSNRPDSYPGWRGQITIEVKPPSYMHRNKSHVGDGWGSSYFENTIINTGSGGGGGGSNKDTKKYSYGITLWAADFPVMYEKWRKWQWCEEENRKRRLVWRSLGGNQVVPEVYEVPDDWVLPSPWEQ